MSDPRLPSFIIAGAAKSATTWLQQSLQGSPRIFMPAPEPHFFSRHHQAGIASYAALFADAGAGAILGEKSNSYLTTPGAEARLHAHLPDTRLIFQLRDPVERAYSDYAMLFRRGEVDGDIGRHLDPDRAATGRFLHDGCYALHLSRFYDLFAPEQILVLLYEQMTQAPGRQLDQLAAHIGLQGALAPPLRDRVKDARSAAVPRPLRRLLAPLRPALDPLRQTALMRGLRTLVARPYEYPALDPVLRAEIAAFYRPHNAALMAMTGISLRPWSQDRTPADDQGMRKTNLPSKNRPDADFI